MTLFKLKQSSIGHWYIYAPRGHVIAGPFYGPKFRAIDWAYAFISSWLNSSLDIDETIN